MDDKKFLCIRRLQIIYQFKVYAQPVQKFEIKLIHIFVFIKLYCKNTFWIFKAYQFERKII
jgi:hypothetical protein